MFSYRHGFHAGNHADVLKHVVLVQLLRMLTQKEKPLWYIDTHAGAGRYALDRGYAAQSAEFESGIARLWTRRDLPAAIEEYVAAVRCHNPDGRLHSYPGSPELAAHLLRAQDRLRLFELHSSESQVLLRQYRAAAPRVLAQAADGFEALRSVLPVPSRRALVLIDPSYEDKRDYRSALAALKDAQRRMSTAVLAIWYPRVQRREARAFPQQLRALQPGDWLDVSLDVKRASPDGLGLHGSGMVILNPPYPLRAALEAALPYLKQVLAQDEAAVCALAGEMA